MTVQTAMGSERPHVVLTGVEYWGHGRPMCALAARLATFKVYVTLLTTPRVYERVKTEVLRGIAAEDGDSRNRLRVVALDTLVDGDLSIDRTRKEVEHYLASFVFVYGQLMEGRPVTCTVSKSEFPILAAPSMIVIDITVGSLARSIPATYSHSKAKIIMYTPTMVSYGYMCFGPSPINSEIDLVALAHKEAERSGRPLLDVADSFVQYFTDHVCEIPGFPKMYHYEFDPQETSHITQGSMGSIWLGGVAAHQGCDGQIIASPYVYEPAGIDAYKEWFAKTDRPVWCIGPLVPPAANQEAIKAEESLSENSEEIRKFMDSALSAHGKHSVLYISFGSVFWPSQPEKLETFMDVVLEKKIPFILSYGSPVAKLSDAFKTKIEDSGLGVLTRWAPQQSILAHPALGWFLTHAGHNSSLEAVTLGVPMICWPFNSDQPANAVHLSVNLEVAYELMEIRTASGLKPIHRTGKAPLGTLDAIRNEARDVLDKAFGEDGARKRENVVKLKEQIDAAWSPGGFADIDMKRLLESL